MNHTFYSKHAFFRRISGIFVFAIINALFLAISLSGATLDGGSAKTEIAAPLVEATPMLVKDINATPFSYASNPSGFTAVGTTVFFVGSDVTHGVALWKTDGTGTGTVMVKDIYLDIDSGYSNDMPQWLTNVNGTLFFIANNGDNGSELWKSDD